MAIFFAMILASVAAMAGFAYWPDEGALERQLAFNRQVVEDMRSMEDALRGWFAVQADARQRPVTGNILPASSADWTRMMQAFGFRAPRADPNGNPYFVKYMQGNVFANITPGVDVVPLDRDSLLGFYNAPICVIASPGFNGVWDMPTAANIAGLTVPTNAALADVINGKLLQKGDDYVHIVRFDRELDAIISASEKRLQSVIASLSIYFNYQAATNAGVGWYPVDLDTLATWLGVVDGLTLNGGTASQSLSVVDGFGYPLQYAVLAGLGGNANKPISVSVDVRWFSAYALP